jgi:allantoate deiminase
MGPRAIAGTFDLDCLELKDRDGISLKKALNDFGCQAEEIPQLVRKPEDFLGFVEIHIEQGPVLEDMERGLGVVTSICGIERWKVSLFGKAGHAGTTPMELRKDALAGAAEVALEVEKVCRATQGAVGIVGRIETFPNVVNVIPAQVDFTIELRAGEDSVRSKISSQIANATRRIALDRQLKLDMEKTYEQKAVPCDEALSGALANAVLEVQGDAPKLMSGATHDASAMADVCPIAMLFVRCTDGLSHHPDEAMTAQDGALAIATLECFLKKLADN